MLVFSKKKDVEFAKLRILDVMLSDGKQRVLGRETALLSLCKTNCLFVISMQLYLIGNLFLLSLFLLLFLFLLLKFFPLGKLNNFPRISIVNNLRALRVDNIIILIKARTLFENIISNIPQIQLGKKTEKRKKKNKKNKKNKKKFIRRINRNTGTTIFVNLKRHLMVSLNITRTQHHVYIVCNVWGQGKPDDTKTCKARESKCYIQNTD